MEKLDQDKEFAKFIIMFLALEEQSTHLIGKTKREQKQIFNRWRKETMRLVKEIEKTSDMDFLDDCKDLVHQSLSHL